MQRDSHNALGSEVFAPETRQQRSSQGPRQRDAVIVLEVMNNLAEPGVEDEGRTSEIKLRSLGKTCAAQCFGHRYAQTAAKTERRFERCEPSLTPGTQRPPAPIPRRFPTHHAIHRKDKVQNRIEQRV